MKSKKIKSKKPMNPIKDSSSSTKTKFIIVFVYLFVFLFSIIALLQDETHPVDKIIFLAFTVFVILHFSKLFLSNLLFGVFKDDRKDKRGFIYKKGLGRV